MKPPQPEFALRKTRQPRAPRPMPPLEALAGMRVRWVHVPTLRPMLIVDTARGGALEDLVILGKFRRGAGWSYEACPLDFLRQMVDAGHWTVRAR